MLDEDSKVYKLVGPVLMSVELEEAKENISKRLLFIESEVTKVEKEIGNIYLDNFFLNNINFYYTI